MNALHRTPIAVEIFLLVLSGPIWACRQPAPTDRVRVSGQVEATDVRVAPQVGGRILDLPVTEGNRIEAGAVVARIDTADALLAVAQARADRAQAVAQLQLLRAGSRGEDISQAESQVDVARGEQAAADSEVTSAQLDVDRFEGLLASNSGSRKQRDDAVARRNLARERARAAGDRVAGAAAALARVKAGPRREEIAAAAARVAMADAHITILDKAITDAQIVAPVAGIVTAVVAEEGEMIAPRAPLIVITDLDHAWANVYVDEPIVPRLKLGQPATVYTDAGGAGIAGTVSYISPKAEFTPRNVQTAEDRSQLVYRIKIAVDNAAGVLKAGMPVEAELPFQP